MRGKIEKSSREAKEVKGGPFAHSANEKGEWHGLRDHLEAVASLAEGFAENFGTGEWAGLAGWWHDLGKYLPEFQRMLLEVERGQRKRRVDHSSVGAIHAAEFFRPLLAAVPNAEELEFVQLLLTATIAGHHAGLPETLDALRARLEDRQVLYNRVVQQAPPTELLNRRFPQPPTRVIEANGRERRLRCEFLVRMVFSALIDADRLDTAEVRECSLPEGLRPSVLRSSYASVATLRVAVDRAIDEKIARLDPARMEPLEAGVFRYRQEVLAACRAAADWAPGAFTLDVATGGGKTLASLSFGLRHAQQHDKRRVIVVIPYTSIIEQTANAYREALGQRLASNLLEHHSARDEVYDDEQQDPDRERLRLATENWDAPLVVTTGVQFFESFFARSASRCRKLHNIANSVVVLDEAQTLPPDLLNPTVWVINELVEGYGVSVVLSTATQPALERPFPEVRNVKRIVRDAVERPPERVRVEVMDQVAIAWSDLAIELATHERVLCITHRRDDARELTLALDKKLGSEGTIHLSGTMCATHRAERIAEIRRLLADGAVCRVVSTQLVEAGVDLDFPVVFRALGGVDSLIQAAGRANREGRLGEGGGLLRVYRSPTRPPAGLPRKGAEVSEAMLRSAEMDCGRLNLFEPAVGLRFFKRYYESIGDKDRGITPMRQEFRFGDVEKGYRFIDDVGATLVVAFNDEAREAVAEARSARFPGRAIRRLQRFTVTIYPPQLQALLQVAATEPLLPGQEPSECSLFLLLRSTLYDRRFGLDLSGVGRLTPGEFIQ